MLPRRNRHSNRRVSEASWLLAFLAGTLATSTSTFVFRGWAVEGNLLDVVPLLAAIAMCWGSVAIVGRLPAGPTAGLSAFFVALSICGGKFLAWDLAGIMARLQGDGSAAPVSVLARFEAGLFGAPTAVVVMNVVLYVAGPVVAYVIARYAPAMQVLQVDLRQGEDERRRSRFFEPAFRKRLRATPSILVLWIIAIGSLYAVQARGERTGFRIMTMPTDVHHTSYSLLGFSVFVGTRPMMAETIPATEQVTWFSGGVRSDNNFRFLRGGYGFLGAQLAPFFTQRTALLVVNGIAWIVCLALVWRLTQVWFDSSQAAAIAVAFATVGLGFAIHVNETVPHMLSFALYYVGIAWFQSRGLSQQMQPWRVHLAIGVFLGLVSLCYNVAQMLLFVYWVVSVRRQPWRYLVGCAAIALSFRMLWRWCLPAFGINVVDVESEYLSVSLRLWAAFWDAGVVPFLGNVARYAVEVATSFESPWLLLCGAAGLIGYVRCGGRDLLVPAALLAPLLAGFVFAPSTASRGYIVFGASVVLYPAVGGLWAWGIRRQGGMRSFAGAACLGLLLLQTVWSTAHFAAWLGPIKSYFVGWDDAMHAMGDYPMSIVSLTGSETVPQAFGGTAPFSEAGLIETASRRSVDRRSWVLAFATRLPLVVALLVFISLLLPKLHPRRWGVFLLLGWWFVGTAWAFAATRTEMRVFDWGHALPLRPSGCLTVTLEPGAGVRDHLAAERAGGQHTLLVCHFATDPDALRLRLQADGRPVAVEQHGAFVAVEHNDWMRLVNARQWQVELCNTSDAEVSVAGWQTNPATGRRVDGGRPVVPHLEWRIVDPMAQLPHWVAF